MEAEIGPITMVVMFILFAVLPFVGLSLAIVSLIKNILQFRKGINPYRRFCRTCDQQQDYHQMAWARRDGYGWWEAMQTIQDENCKCHKYARS